jgi:hypothetical protein
MRDNINSMKISSIVEVLNDTPLAQRVGYVLEEIGGKPANPLHKWLKQREIHTIKLEPSLKPGLENNQKWSININTTIEADEV